MAALTIGALARRAGVHVETIRYYQRLGLLPVPERPPSGFRRYREADLQRLRFIKRAQRMGFSLREIGELLRLEQADCRQVQQLAEQKLAQVEARLAELERLRTVLAEAVGSCRKQPTSGCELLRRLLADEA
ncbi:MerR family transcriptional regulator, mercuric resistance operon regulatory protein [Methylomarinovum tepidoasis]|uniref:MerR family transcriptional regulator, mercuric resistance operon regulatory protein n=1 Tax=Methylomarinovum tepidoasis TaxID=2840183 RepID=A0AAU9C165_9GAMM|nr:MerR family transcriptional regulator [Methylomarinovum sp. IN45]BCX89840.1 MerR family transcriptional regulator, mercuric resistance operon regulatory protein [Methylomarinovum sp. IN45]